MFYLLVGVAVSVAVFLRDAAGDSASRTLRMITAVIFWPLYLPILLTRPQAEQAPKLKPSDDPGDEMAKAMAQVDAELQAGSDEPVAAKLELPQDDHAIEAELTAIKQKMSTL